MIHVSRLMEEIETNVISILSMWYCLIMIQHDCSDSLQQMLDMNPHNAKELRMPSHINTNYNLIMRGGSINFNKSGIWVTHWFLRGHIILTIDPSLIESKLITVTWKLTLVALPTTVPNQAFHQLNPFESNLQAWVVAFCHMFFHPLCPQTSKANLQCPLFPLAHGYDQCCSCHLSIPGFLES